MTDIRYLAIVGATAAGMAFAAMAEDAQKPAADAPAIPPVVSTSPSPQVPPQPAPAPQKFYLEVDQSDINSIGAALNELPKRIADPIILKLNGQLQAQVQIQANRAKAIAEPAKVDPPKDNSDAKDEVLAHRARRHRT